MQLAPTLFERSLRLVWPAAAERQYTSRLRFEQARAVFAGADDNRLTGGWRTVDGNQNPAVLTDRRLIASRARYLANCTSHGTSCLTYLQDSTVGTGIGAQCQAVFATNDPDRQHQLRISANDARARWNERADWERRSCWEDFEETAFRELLIDGNVLLREMIEPNYLSLGMTIPLTYQAIQADRLTSAATSPVRGNEIYGGIEVDQHGRTVAYHVASDGYRLTVERVPVAEMIHGYRMDFPGQRIGMSWFSPVIPEMAQFDEIKQYKMVAYKVQNALAIVISEGAEPAGNAQMMGLAPPSPATTSGGNPLTAIQAGMIHNVGKGKAHSHIPTPSNDIDIMTKLLLRSIGIGMGTSYEAISGDYSGVNFAGGRLGVLQNRKRVNTIHSLFCRRVELPAHRRFVAFSRQFDRSYPRAIVGAPDKVKFTRPKFDLGVNPMQEVNAMVAMIKNGLSSLEIEAGSLGRDWSDVMVAIEGECDFDKALSSPDVHPVLTSQPKTTGAK